MGRWTGEPILIVTSLRGVQGVFNCAFESHKQCHTGVGTR